MKALLLALLLAGQAPGLEPFAYRQRVGADALTAEIAQLRPRAAQAKDPEAAERLISLLVASDAASPADARARLREIAAFREALRIRIRVTVDGFIPPELAEDRWIGDAAAAATPEARALFLRMAADQSTLRSDVPDSLGEAGRVAVTLEVRRLATANAEWLKRMLARIGWFDISRYGAEASQAAWLIVQHADHDPAWQRQVLEVLRPRVARGDMQPNYFAYLVDRIAVNAGQPQTYGTQGHCIGPGDWQPFELIEPAALDARRAAVGLPPIAQYRQMFGCR